MFQPALELYTPRYRIPMECVTSVADMISCELTTTGSNWSSSGTVDHPSFDRLRTHLERKHYIAAQRNCWNGDSVLKDFYLNDVLFQKGDRFLSAAAMGSYLERSEKIPMKTVEPKVNYDAELRDWVFRKSYYHDGLVATGIVYNDSKGRFLDGEGITTSLIKNTDGLLLITENSVYKLV